MPSVSRDGRRIAFVRQAPRGPMEIWIMNADGSAPRRLASARSLSSPTWSPDGKRLAYVRQTGRSELWLMSANGSGKRRVELPKPPSPGTENWPYQVSSPAWSPDARTIAFSNGQSLWSVSLGTGDVRRLARCNRGYCFSPSWSPSGRLIAYQHRRAGGEGGGGHGGKPRVVVPTNRGGGGTPSWSPDGRFIVFNRGYLPHPYQELAVVSANGGPQRRLTTNFVDDSMASWGR